MRAEVSAQCHVVVGEVDVEEVDGSGALWIGQHRDHLEHGGHIALTFEKGRPAFWVNKTASEEDGLTLSSELLSLARGVL